MCKSCILGFVAFLGSVSSIIGASQLAIVVIYYTELPSIFLILSLVTGTFVFTLSCCIVGSIIVMVVRATVIISVKIGVSLALGSMCVVTTFNLLILLLQCHWILDQKVLTDIGPFQLQCIKSVTDISEGIFLLILANSVTLGISTFALLLTCFWKVRSHLDVFQVSVVSSNWVYDNNSVNTNNISEINDMTLSDHNFKQSRQFGNTHVQIPKINFKSARRGSVSSNNQLLRNFSYCPESPEPSLHSFANIIAAISPLPLTSSENALVRLTSFAPADVTEQSSHYYEQPCSLSPEQDFSQSNFTEDSSALKCSIPSNNPKASTSDPKHIANSEDICHWLKRGKWRKHAAPRKPARNLKPTVRTPYYTPPPSCLKLKTDNRSESDPPLAMNKLQTDELVTPKQDNLPKIEITPPNEDFNGDIKDAIYSLDSVLHLTPSVSTASYRNSTSPQSSESSRT